MELIIALVLFVGLIACWAFLPGTVSGAALLRGDKATSENPAPARVSA